jgi:hypothetical protein
MSTLATTNIKHPSSASNNIVLDSAGGVDLDALTVSGSAPADSVNIDASGRLLVGTSTAPAGSDAQYARIAIRGNTLNDNASILSLGNKQTTASTADSTNLGIITFNDNDSTTGEYARITCSVDGNPGASDYPGRIVLATTADGASSPTERVRLTSAGRLGIGTPSPGSVCHVAGSNGDGLTVSGGGATGVFRSSASGTELGNTSGDHTVFLSGSGTERMKITNGGIVGINTTDYANGRFIVTSDSSAVTNTVFIESAAGAASVNTVGFKRGGSFVGTISTTTTATAYNTSSDYRLKENVTLLTSATDRLKQIPVHRFNFIADPDHTVDGFLAHEAQAVVPECVTGTKDEVEVWKEGDELPDGVSVNDNKLDEDGNTIPVYQGIDQSKLVPLLTAALQEAIGRIETLEAEVAALKAP